MMTPLLCQNRRRLFWLSRPTGRARALQPADLELRQTQFPLAGPPDLAPESAPDFPAAEASRPESFLRIEGALAARQLDAPLVLPSWTMNFLVSNSVVQFAANRAGQVISAVLLDGSGLKEADDYALAKVNVLRFRPVEASAPEYAWDTATFYWKTIPPRRRIVHEEARLPSTTPSRPGAPC